MLRPQRNRPHNQIAKFNAVRTSLNVVYWGDLVNVLFRLHADFTKAEVIGSIRLRNTVREWHYGTSRRRMYPLHPCSDCYQPMTSSTGMQSPATLPLIAVPRIFKLRAKVLGSAWGFQPNYQPGLLPLFIYYITWHAWQRMAQ